MVRVEVPAREAEIAADLLWAAGASAVGEGAGEAGGDLVTLTADLDACPGGVVERWRCVVEEDDGTWWDGWRPFARAARAGRFLVRPPWVEVVADDGAATFDLVVDAGRSFGTGSHPSTLLALEVVDRLAAPDVAVLDVGCGSGILAVGAALLGADVTAIDVDAAALDATIENAARNGVTDRVTVSATPVTDVVGPFALVLANLGSPLVVELAEAVAGCVAPGGTVVLSGLLADRWAHVPRAYPTMQTVDAPARGGWRAVVLRNGPLHG